MSKDYIYTLIAKHLRGTITDDEATILTTWKSEKKSNQAKYNDIVVMWKKTETFIFPEPIDDSAVFKAVWDRTAKKRKVQFPYTLAVQIAAVLLLAVVLAGTYSYFYLHNGQRLKYPLFQEVSAAYGTRTSIDLPDGSKVMLNSGSSIRFPNFTTSADERRVELEGEAYFEVAKNIKKPFVVSIDKFDVKVLGTTFNVEAYTDNELVLVALVEGSVMIQDKSGGESKDLMMLSPNQVASLNLFDNTLTKTEVADLHKHIGWVTGRIVFFGDPIQTVVRKLGNWYNVDIAISDERLENYSFTGTFIDETLEQVLSTLSLTSPMTYSIQPGEEETDGSMSKRKVILKSRN